MSVRSGSVALVACGGKTETPATLDIRAVVAQTSEDDATAIDTVADAADTTVVK